MESFYYNAYINPRIIRHSREKLQTYVSIKFYNKEVVVALYGGGGGGFSGLGKGLSLKSQLENCCDIIKIMIRN